VARSGLRMMPTFPPSPLSFRTAGFPQYGWKAGMSDSAFPIRPSLKPAPGIRRGSHGLPLSFVHCVVRLSSPVLCRADDYSMHRHGVGFDSAPGALAPIRVLLSRFINAYWPHPTHSRAHRDFADSATYTRCLRCAGAPRRPPSGSALSLYIPSEHAALYAPGEIETRFIQFTGFDIGLRLDPMARLPQTSCHPFPAGLVFGVSWFAFLLRPVQLLASLDGSDQDFSQPQRLLHPGFPRVSHPSRGWISLRQFLDGSVDGTFTHWNDGYLRCTRSVRALLRIRLPPWMGGEKADYRIRMQNAWGWKPPLEDREKLIPRHSSLTTSA
jgi:hypothetical protein